MLDPLDQLRKTLKKHGQSLTMPRQVVFAALQGQEPQAMRDIVAACANKINRASVYRSIALFERLGIVQRLQIGWKYSLELSDAFHQHHHHLTCLNCGQVTPLPEDELLEKRVRALAKTHRFAMRGHQLEIVGVCRNCQKS